MIDYFSVLWINFSLLFVSSFGLCFCKKIAFNFLFGALSLLSIVLNLSESGTFMSDYNGQIIGIILMFVFLLQSVWLAYLSRSSKTEKIPAIFYSFPFLAVILMAISRDVLTFFVALELFFVAFSGLFYFRHYNENKIYMMQKNALISFVLGSAGLWIVYLICGSLSLSAVNDMLQDLSGRNQFLWIGIGLLSLDVMIKINLFSKTIKTKK